MEPFNKGTSPNPFREPLNPNPYTLKPKLNPKLLNPKLSPKLPKPFIGTLRNPRFKGNPPKDPPGLRLPGFDAFSPGLALAPKRSFAA